MEATEDPLSALADIHLPAEVSWWPPAPLWWLVAALVLAAIGYGCYLLFLRWQNRQRLRVALEEIRRAHTRWQQTQASDKDAGLALLHACNSTLKRVALVHYPDTDVAALHGQKWLEFLDHGSPGSDFTGGAGRILADGSYRRHYTADAATAAALVQACEGWITRQYLQPATAVSAAATVEAAA